MHAVTQIGGVHKLHGKWPLTGLHIRIEVRLDRHRLFGGATRQHTHGDHNKDNRA